MVTCAYVGFCSNYSFNMNFPFVSGCKSNSRQDKYLKFRPEPANDFNGLSVIACGSKLANKEKDGGNIYFKLHSAQYGRF